MSDTPTPTEPRAEASFTAAFLRIAAQRRDVPENVRGQMVVAADLLSASPAPSPASVDAVREARRHLADGDPLSAWRVLDSIIRAATLTTSTRRSDPEDGDIIEGEGSDPADFLTPSTPAPEAVVDEHPDDLSVDRFAAAMKSKLAKKRSEGQGGWEDKNDCSNAFLSQLLRDHVEKGDPVDVGNLAMMIHQRGERIAAPAGDVREALVRLRLVAGLESTPIHVCGEMLTIADKIDAALSSPASAATREPRAWVAYTPSGAFVAHLTSVESATRAWADGLIVKSVGTPSEPAAGGVVAITTNGTTRIIPADEPVFLIRGQDVVGGAAVRAWADMSERVGASPEAIKSAREHAGKMEAWPKKKVADLPSKEGGR